MKTAAAFACLSIVTLCVASPALVEESLRITPPGATDLVPRQMSRLEAEPDLAPYKITSVIWISSGFAVQEDDEKKDIFTFDDRIELPSISSALNEPE